MENPKKNHECGRKYGGSSSFVDVGQPSRAPRQEEQGEEAVGSTSGDLDPAYDSSSKQGISNRPAHAGVRLPEELPQTRPRTVKAETLRRPEDLMFKSILFSAGVLLATSTLGNAQSTVQNLPANATPTIQGCVAQVQRDGSLAPKAGATATPATTAREANNPDPTGVYQLLDARLAGDMSAKPTSYSLVGHEAEVARLEGQRVEVTGQVVPPLGGDRPGQSAASDGSQRIRVSTVRKIEGTCSVAKK